MTDNVIITPGVGVPVASDDIGGIQHQRVKISQGVDGSATDVSSTDPLNVTLANTGANGTAINVDGSAVTQPVSIADGSNVTLGAKADAKSTATDTTAITAMSVWKQISASVQAIAASIAGTLTVGTHAVTQSGTWTVQPGNTANTTAWKVDASSVAVPVTDNSGSLTVDAPVGTPVFVRLSDGSSAIATLPVSLASVPSHAVTVASGGIASGAIASGAVASGAVASGAFASGSVSDGAMVTLGAKADAKSSASDTTSITIMQVLKQISFSIQAAAASLAGTLTVASHAVTNAGTFAVQATLQAGTALAGIVSASNETSTIYNGTTALTPKFATIAASSSGNNTIVSAVNPKKIRVLAAQLVANGAVNAKWQSGASGTDLTGLAYLAANGGYVLPYNPVGWFETASNTLLNLNLSGAVAVGGSITYIEV